MSTPTYKTIYERNLKPTVRLAEPLKMLLVMETALVEPGPNDKGHRHYRLPTNPGSRS